MSLFTVVLQLMSISVLPSAFAADADERMLKFGGFNKILAVFAIATVVAGLFTTTIALNWLATFKFTDPTRFMFCKNAGWSLLPGVEDPFGNPAYGFPNVTAVPLDLCTLSTECLGSIAGLPSTFTCCTNKDRTNNLLERRTYLWMFGSALCMCGSLTIIGWALLAYHTNVSPIPWAVSQITVTVSKVACLKQDNKVRTADEEDDLDAKLYEAGLTIKDLQQLPTELLWPVKMHISSPTSMHQRKRWWRGCRLMVHPRLNVASEVMATVLTFSFVGVVRSIIISILRPALQDAGLSEVKDKVQLIKRFKTNKAKVRNSNRDSSA